MFLLNVLVGFLGLFVSCVKIVYKDYLFDVCIVGKLVWVIMDSGGLILCLFLEVVCLFLCVIVLI